MDKAPQPNLEALFPHTHPDYRAIIGRDTRLINWYQFHTQTLPETLRDPFQRAATETVIERFMRNEFGIPDQFFLPPISWVEHNPVIHQITGTSFMVPVFQFTEDQWDTYEALSPVITGGINVPIPIEYMSLGKLSSSQSIFSKIIVFPPDSIQMAMPKTEREPHEFTHVIDPYTHIPSRNLIRNEIIALIGSFSDNFNRFSGITLAPFYILDYIQRQAELMGLKVTPEDLIIISGVICQIVDKATHTLPTPTGNHKMPNDDVVRKMISYADLPTMFTDWPEVNPET